MVHARASPIPIKSSSGLLVVGALAGTPHLDFLIAAALISSIVQDGARNDALKYGEQRNRLAYIGRRCLVLMRTFLCQ